MDQCRRRSRLQRVGHFSGEHKRAEPALSPANQDDIVVSKDLDDLIEDLLKLIEELFEDVDSHVTEPVSAVDNGTTPTTATSLASRFRESSPDAPVGEIRPCLVGPDICPRAPALVHKTSSQPNTLKHSDPVDTGFRLLRQLGSLVAIPAREGAMRSLYKILTRPDSNY
jgi:hypothetical protein